MKLTQEAVFDCIKGIHRHDLGYLQTVPDDELLRTVSDLHYAQFHPLRTIKKAHLVPPYKQRLNIVLIKNLESQVFNGGFDQFLFNYSQIAVDTLIACNEVLGTELAAPLLMAMNVEDVDLRNAIWRSQTPKELLARYAESYGADEEGTGLSRVDTLWYEQKEARAQKTVQYIRANISVLAEPRDESGDSIASPLDVYYDDTKVFELNHNCRQLTEWNNEDVDGSRLRLIKCHAKNADALLDEGDLVGAERVVGDAIWRVFNWEMEEDAILRDLLTKYVQVLEQLHRPKQASTLKKLLEGSAM